MLKKFHKELREKAFRVTIFGSARIKKGSRVYEDVRKFSRMVGQRGFDIVSGGGPGLMEAASRGHKEGGNGNGAHTIGLGIRAKGQMFNKSLNIKKEFHRFSKRLDIFMALSNVVVVAPGGVGTLLELFYTWQLVQVEHICSIPIILVGKQWPPFIEWLEKYPLKNKYFSRKDFSMLFLADDFDEAIKMVDKAYEKYKKGEKDFCLNYKKYKLE